MIQQEQSEQIKELESLYKEFEYKFAVLKSEQDKLIADFLEGIRQKKIEDLKTSINNSN